jgi:aldehyde dehydrogenase (NAD+)
MASNPSLDTVVEQARKYFQSQNTRSESFRRERLKALLQGLDHCEGQLYQALHEDLGKPEAEAYAGEVGPVSWEIKHALRHLHDWMSPESVSSSMLAWPARARRCPQPRGTALIIAPWNFPMALALRPLVGAIAAGCNAVIKPSELAPSTSSVLAQMIRHTYGDDGYVSVVPGGADVSIQLLEKAWDLIFFTGSSRVGSLVMGAAAKRLTPVVLELGGKSPVIVDKDVDLTIAARRIAWGKFANAGQTCVAPDYLLVHQSIASALVNELGAAIRGFYGEEPMRSRDYGRIVSPQHVERLVDLMAGGRVAYGGAVDRATRFVAPTLLTEVDLSHRLMQEEIFGPLLPIVEVESIEHAIRFVRERPDPLALYVFSMDSGTTQGVIDQTASGGVTVNDVMMHLLSAELPFGGVGASGMGAYHGKASFDTFTHYKSVVEKGFGLDVKLRYPPYPALPSWLRRRG